MMIPKWSAFFVKCALFLGLPGLVLLTTVRCNPSSAVAGGSGEAGAIVAAGDLIGAPYRVVWARDVEHGGKDPFGYLSGYKLMGYDTVQGEVEILSELASYRKPMFTPDGQRIVFSDFISNEMRIVNWDGSGLQTLGKGVAMELWTEPKTGKVWLYYLDCNPNVAILAAGRPLVRAPLANISAKEPIWNKTDLTLDSFQLSADGKRAACLTPWPTASMMDLEAGKIRMVGKGCWVAMSPDNSYNMWVFDGPHKNLVMRMPGQRFPRKVYLSGAPGVENFEVYHPRWSNHPRVMAMTGPYKIMGKGNAIGGGGPTGIYVGRFEEGFAGVEAWAQITSGEVDRFPDVWVEGGETAGVNAPKQLQVANVDAANIWPSNPTGLEYVWKNSMSQNTIDVEGRDYRKCGARLIGRARFGQFGQAILHNGGLTGLRMEEPLAKAVAASDEFSIEFAVFMIQRGKYAKDAVIAGQASSLEDGNFVLLQSELYGKPYLHLKFRTDQGTLKEAPLVELFTLPVNSVVHLAITYKEGEMAIYMNGEPKEAISRLKGELNWTPHPLVFGGLKSGAHDWPGLMENVAVYSRALSPEEVSSHSKFYWNTLGVKGQNAAPEITVNATLKEMTPQRPPQSLGSYRRDLVEYAYEVNTVTAGVLDEKEIKVLHWSILDRESLPVTKKIGQAYDLRISPVADRPELEGERVNGGQLTDPTLPGFLDLSDP